MTNKINSNSTDISTPLPSSGQSNKITPIRPNHELSVWGKVKAFFTDGILGKVITTNATTTLAELGASLVAGKIAGDYLGQQGEKLGTMLGYSIVPLTTVAIGTAMMAMTSPSGQSLIQSIQNKFKQITVLKGFIAIMMILTMVTAHFKVGDSLADSAGELNKNLFQFIGSSIASIIAGYQVASFSSKMSFEEYLKRNVQQTAFVSYVNWYSPAAFSLPRDLIYGALAYNTQDIWSLIKPLLSSAEREKKDIALRIKDYIESSNTKQLLDAEQAKEKALTRGEDVSKFDEEIKRLTNSSFATKKIFENLESLLRSGFGTFNAYQEIISGDDVANAQYNLIETYRKTYNEAKKSNDQHTIKEAEKAKEASVKALSTAIAKSINRKQSVLGASLASLIRPLHKNLVLQKIDLPKIPELEKMVLGFSITDDLHTEIANTLINIHLQHFSTLATLNVFRTKALDTVGDQNLIKGLLTLVNNHYSRISPDSKTPQLVETILQAVFTTLQEGPKAALNQFQGSKFEEFSEVEILEARLNSDDEDFEIVPSEDEVFYDALEYQEEFFDALENFSEQETTTEQVTQASEDIVIQPKITEPAALKTALKTSSWFSNFRLKTSSWFNSFRLKTSSWFSRFTFFGKN